MPTGSDIGFRGRCYNNNSNYNMTLCTIDFDDDLWDGFDELKPDEINLATAVERAVAEKVHRNQDAECIDEQHVRAAEYVLNGAVPEQEEA